MHSASPSPTSYLPHPPPSHMLDPLAPDDLFGTAGAPDDRGAIPFRRVRDVGEVLSATFAFVRENVRELGWGLLVIVGPAVVISTALSALLRREFLSSLGGLDTAETTDPTAFLRVFTSPYYFAALGIGLITPILASAVVYAYVRLYREGRAGSVTPGVLWAETTHLLGPVFSVSLALVASVLLVIIPCLGALAWLVGFVVFLPVVVLAPVARAMGAESVGDAVRRARALAQGEWGPTVGAALLAGLVFFAVALLLAIPGAMLGLSLGMSGLMGAVGWTTILWGAVSGLVVYAAYAIPVLAVTFQYFNLVERKEGHGLTARVDALAATSPDVPRADGGDEGFGLRQGAGSEAPPEPPVPRPGFRGSGLGDEG